MQVSTPVATNRKFFYGWVVVGGGWGIHIILAPTYIFGMSMFFNPIREEMAWGAAVTSLAFSMRSFQSGIMAPVAGFMIDRFGARTMMMSGMFIIGLGMILVGRIDALWQFYLAFLLMSVGASIGYGQAMTAAAVNWFRRLRVRAISLMFTGGSIGGFLVPLVALAITGLGWRMAITVCGFIVWGIAIPLASLMNHRPDPEKWGPDGDPPPGRAAAAAGGAKGEKPQPGEKGALTAKEAIRTRAFWIITVSAAVSHLATGMVLTVHLIPFLESNGISKATAAGIIAVFSLCSLPARLMLGWVGDRLESRMLNAMVYGMAALAIISLSLSHSFMQALPYAVLAGMARGAQAIVEPVLVSEQFGTKRFASIAGLAHSLSLAAGVVGPLLGGLAYDYLGSYRPAFLAVGIFALIACPLVLTLPKVPKPPARAKAA